ncbi:MAG: hypothetical protein C4334_00485 [Pyrinomonas sp.]|uniref:serine hydrolase domain-containing protein n=1 Tax=Pyrinomonas sp. TaxID=2080306 RepID=UPI0033317F52
MNDPRPEPNISRFLAERIAAGDFPSAVYAIAQRGCALFADALGDSVIEPERRTATLKTIYDLASLTKPLVTGLLIARLLDKEAFSLDDEVANYLPPFRREDKRKITIRHLVTHASGLPAWRPLYLLAEGDPHKALDVIAQQPLECAPGERVIYSDLGFIALGFLIERLTDRPFGETAHQEIFAPLALQRTLFNPSESLRAEIAASEMEGTTYEREMCRQLGAKISRHNWREGVIWGEVHDENARFLGGASAHAGLFSSVDETVRLAREFLASSATLLQPAACELFRTNMTPDLNEARSLAWQLAATPDSTAGPDLPPDAFGHTGFTGTSCWLDPQRERIFVLLTNRTHVRARTFANINGVRRRFHSLAVAALDASERDA